MGVVTIELNFKNFQLLFYFMALKIPFLKALRDLIPAFCFTILHSVSGRQRRKKFQNSEFSVSDDCIANDKSLGSLPTRDLRRLRGEVFLFTSYDRTQFSKNVSCFFRLFCEKRSKHLFFLQNPAQHFHTFSSISAKNIPFRLNLQFLCEIFSKKSSFSLGKFGTINLQTLPLSMKALIVLEFHNIQQWRSVNPLIALS